jgi:hypothetical protein
MLTFQAQTCASHDGINQLAYTSFRSVKVLPASRPITWESNPQCLPSGEPLTIRVLITPSSHPPHLPWGNTTG